MLGDGRTMAGGGKAGGDKPRPYIPFVPVLVLLAFLLVSCGFPGISSTAAQLPAAKTTPAATPLPPVRFPQDEAPHRDLTEWWYYTGHLNVMIDGRQHHYGFELVFFQVLRSDFPPVYAAHFAMSDVTRGQFHFEQRSETEANAVLPNGTTTTGFNLNVGDWVMRGVNGHDHLLASMADYSIDLSLDGLKPPALHNGNGIITYGLAGFSYYYSRTRMAVSGTLDDHGVSSAVNGEAWMDHQWGNFLTLGGGGWDWFSIQLNNDTELMLYFIRDSSGHIISTYAGYVPASGREAQLSPQSMHIQVLGHWRSPATGIVYPSGWLVQIRDAPLQVALTLQPELKDQELVVYQSTGNAYWEGAVSVTGQDDGSAVGGEGYVELTGY